MSPLEKGALSVHLIWLTCFQFKKELESGGKQASPTGFASSRSCHAYHISSHHYLYLYVPEWSSLYFVTVPFICSLTFILLATWISPQKYQANHQLPLSWRILDQASIVVWNGKTEKAPASFCSSPVRLFKGKHGKEASVWQTGAMEFWNLEMC